MSFGWLWYLSVIPALGFLVFVHELGHFLVGIKMGVKIEEFGFGYPPRMLTLFHYKGIPVTINWLPLGGFVRFAGEEGNFDDPNSLAAASPARKIPIMAAGAIMNLLTAIVIFSILAPFGRPEPIGKVSVSEVVKGTPADGVLVAKDRILAVNEKQVRSASQLKAEIDQHRGQAIKLTIERDKATQEATLTPLVNPPAGQGAVGIKLEILQADVERIEYVDRITNPLAALWSGVTNTFSLFINMLMGIAGLFASLFGFGRQATGGVAGPVGIARMTGEIARSGWWRFLDWTAILSVNLALINLLPIPALDGSRIVFALVEWVRGKKVPPQREALVHAAGMMLLLGLMLLITFTDIRAWLGGRSAFGG